MRLLAAAGRARKAGRRGEAMRRMDVNGASRRALQRPKRKKQLTAPAAHVAHRRHGEAMLRMDAKRNRDGAAPPLSLQKERRAAAKRDAPKPTRGLAKDA